MADKQISSLPQAQTVDDSSLFVLEQQGTAMKATGAQWKGFAVQAVSQYVEPAQQAAKQAQQAAQQATQAVGKIGTAVEDTKAAQAAAEAARDEAVAAGAGIDEKVTRAETAAQTATEKAGQAATSESNAALSAGSAESAKQAAETAKQAAESAQGAAEAASGTATSSATQAAQSAQNAQQSEQAAQTAKEGAEAAKAAIENLGVDATTLESGRPATVQKTVENGVVKLTFGLPSGDKGEKGDTGASIERIEKVEGTGAPGTSDTYNVVRDDGQVVGQYSVYNGADGMGAGDMLKAVYDPQNKNTDVFAYIDQAVQNVPVPDVSEQIAEHNTDGTAHPDLRAELAKKETSGAAAAVQSNLDAHVKNTQNPHDVKAEQVGAIPAPPGGSEGQVLTKTANGQEWRDAPDTGVTTFNGRTGHVTPKTGDYTAEMVGARSNTWTPNAADVGAMPAVSGGTEGQVLTKTSNGQEWQDAPDGLPDGGAEGQILIKTASGAAWGDVPSSGGAHYVSVFTAEDWVKAERDSTITISAATHKLTGPIVDCRAFTLISGGYRAGYWAAMETYATVEWNGDIVLHYPNSAGYDGAAVLTAYAPGS